jgi:hypothetical protein
MKLRSAIKVWVRAQQAFKAAYGAEVPDDIPLDMMRQILGLAGVRRGSFDKACTRLFSRPCMKPYRYKRMMAAAELDVVIEGMWS